MSKSNKKIQLKSLFIITICLLIVSTNIHAYQLTPECNVTIEHNRYIIHFVLPDYNIETEDDDDCGVFSQIDMAADYGTTDDPGYPSIPYFKLNLLIPQGATNTTVSFTINDLEVITLSDPLIPSKMGDIINENNNFSQLDEGCYNQEYYQYGYTGEFPNGYYPNYYTISPIYSYYYTQGTTLSIYPFSYQPVNGIINVVLEATICIEFDYGDLIETIDDLYQGQDFKSIITMLLYDTFNEFDVSLDLENKGDYLIIAAHRDMENILESYIAYKQSQNYNVEVVYLDEENALGNPTAIHQLIYSSSFLDNPDFVLLVGSLQDIPPYMGEDNIFNPFSDDPYHPLLGRWITTGENGYYPELINIIFKTTSSEVAYLSTTPTIESFSGTGTRTASRSFWKDIEMIDDKYVSQMGISNCMHDGRVYASSLHACLSIDSALCNNPRLFIYRGHGASDTNSCIIAPPYWLKSIATSHSSSMDLSLLTNTDPYPIGIGYACCLNSYLTNNNFGAKWISINGGGVEFYSSTVTSYRASNRALAKAEFSRLKTLTERLGNFPISLWLKLGEWDYLYACQSFPRYQQIYKYNLIGDPTFYVYGMSGEPQLYYSRNNQQMLSTHINGNNIEKVEIYDLSGNLIAIDGLKYNTTKHNSRTGVYIVRTIYKNGNINIYKLLQ